ncbi:MAG: sensor histidine kinase [Syntrophomonadaceae bacterium]|nr:sensor histidine kinase [Syntrophomonadaceae bacterium]
MASHFEKRIKDIFPNLFNFLNKHALTGKTNDLNHINPTVYIRKALLTARFLLVFLTSLFYLAGPPQSALHIKISVVLAMLAAVILAQSLYNNKEIVDLLFHIYDPYKTIRSCKSKKSLLLFLLGIEITGTVLVTLPTGGLSSPFVWYALSPIMVSAFYLRTNNSWLTMGLFLTATLLLHSTLMGFALFEMSVLVNHMSLIMIFCITTALCQMFAVLFKELARAHSKLEAAHVESKNALAHTTSLYQALEACSYGEDHLQIADILAEYAARLCRRPAACFIKEAGSVWLDSGLNSRHLKIAGEFSELYYRPWEQQLDQLCNQLTHEQNAVLPCSWDHNCSLICQPLYYHGESFGILSCLAPRDPDNSFENNMKSLSFLAGLGAITLERLQADKLFGRLLVSEEQNRIANDIHDGVAQYLFSMACSLHLIGQQNTSVKDPKVQQQLKLLENLASKAARELKASIYGLSPHKRGENIFVEMINSYLDDLGRMHGIRVDLQAEGNESVLSPSLRKALYRLIREACSNAIRHGKCESLTVSLKMDMKQILIEIQDDGCGLHWKKIKELKKNGLGLGNMIQTAERYGGKLEIDSVKGKGTTIRCMIPHLLPDMEKEVRYVGNTAH